jgi:hypothetical protein
MGEFVRIPKDINADGIIIREDEIGEVVSVYLAPLPGQEGGRVGPDQVGTRYAVQFELDGGSTIVTLRRDQFEGTILR